MSKIIFWGTPDFSLASLKALDQLKLVSAVVTQADKPAGRGKKIQISPVKQYALEHDLFIFQPEEFDERFINELKQFLPATFVVVAYGKIIPQNILDLSEKPALNIHPSRLPILRGPSPIQTALLEGFSSTAVSLMQIDQKMDHGPILGQIEAKIEAEDDYLSLSQKLAGLGAELLAKNILDYLAGNSEPQIQDDDSATICKLIKKEDGKISWQKPAEDILNQIRAFVAWPGSFTKLKGLEFKIQKAKISDQKLAPEEIKIEKEKLFIGTQTEALQILELQLAGKKTMLAADFIRGYQNKLK
ncbi:methionyl-tRNA formyltransferase [Candidatus Nomurabacteria bacterium]|nr:methionyl-tRNA formyltransferase [Candidatus Nomurabacteria bacterium]